MRDIKFRAWNKILNRIDNWYDLVDKNLRNIFIMKDHNGYELMQYTGLHDKNGKEIYEGDIVKDVDDGRIGIIKFIENMTGFFLVYGECISSIIINVEVIGNIYENSELLKEVK